MVYEDKGKERKSIYITLFWPRRYAQSAQAWITQLPANNTMPAFPSSAFTRCHHHSNWGSGHPITAHYSFIDPRKDERLSWPSWLTYSRWFTLISGHPSATVDRRTAKARQPKTDVLPLDHATNQDMKKGWGQANGWGRCFMFPLTLLIGSWEGHPDPWHWSPNVLFRNK